MKKYSKKLLSVFLVAVIVLTAIPLTGIMSLAIEPTEDSLFDLTIRGSTCEIWGLKKEVEHLVIPGKINGYTVTGFGSWAFSRCNYLKSVTFLDDLNISEIDFETFKGCSSLEKVVIGKGVKSVGDYAFRGCVALKTLVIGEGVTRIGTCAFANCSSLKSVNVPNNVTYLGDWAFENCDSLEEAMLPTEFRWSFINDPFYGCFSLKTIYGKAGSDAEDVALNYNCRFIDYLFSRVDTIPIKSDEINIVAFNKEPFAEGSVNLVNSSSDAANYKLSGVNLTATNISETFDKNFSLTSKYANLDLTFSCENHQNVYVPAEVVNSWLTYCNAETRNIYLGTDKKDTKPYITGAYGRETDGKVAYTDLQYEELSAEVGKKYDIILTADLQDETSATYILTQDNAHRLTSTDGRFSAKVLTETFAAGKDIYAFVQTASGKTSAPVKLELKTDGAEFNENTIDLFGNDGQKITFSEDTPLIGGAEISMDGFKFPLGIEVEGNRFKISFGMDIFSLKSENGEKWENDTWESYKKSVSTVLDSVDSTTEKLNQYKTFYDIFAPGQSYLDKGKNFDVNLLGYAEGYFVDGKPVFTDTCGEIVGKFKFEYTHQGVVWVIPYYAYVEAGADFSAKAQWVRLVPDSDVPMDFGFLLKVNPNLTIGGGVGVKGAVSGGLYGEGALPIENDFSAKHTLVQLTGAVGIEGEFFIFKGKKELFSGSLTLWDNYYGSAQAFRAKINGILPYQPKIAEQQTTQTEVMPRDYLENTSKWLGDSLLKRKFGIRSAVSDGLSVKELQTSVFKNSSAQLIALDDGRMITAYIEDDSARDTYNRMRLVYSVYENGLWSAPKAVYDDGTNDACPVLATDGKNVYVAWQNINRALTEADEASMNGVLGATEINLAKFNAETNGFENAKAVTANDTYDYAPCIAVENGEAAVYWVNNAQCDLRIPESNTICRYTTVQDKTESVKTSVNYILDMKCSFDEVSYSADSDGVLATTKDVNVFTVANGETKQSSNSNCADFNVAYGKLNGKNTLFYANNSGIYYNDGAEIKPVFEATRTVNGDLQVLENGTQTSVMWSEVSDAGTELWLCNYADGKWSEPIQITKLDALLHGISAVYQDGTIHGVFDRTQRNLVNEEYVNGQTDLCYMTLKDYTDLETSFGFIVESSLKPGKTVQLPVNLTNSGTKNITSVDITLKDTLGTEITVNKAVELPSGSEITVNVNYLVPENFGKTTLEVTATVSNEQEINTYNNTNYIELGFADIGIREVQVEEVGQYFVLTTILSNDNAIIANGVTLKLHLNDSEGKLIEYANIGDMQPGEIKSVQYIVSKKNMEFDENGIGKVCFETSTSSEEKVTADNITTAVMKYTDILYGDVNNDGTVNNLDRLLLTRYLADWDEYSADTINILAADVNNDGMVNNLDRLILTRYLADWEDYGYLPYVI